MFKTTAHALCVLMFVGSLQLSATAAPVPSVSMHAFLSSGSVEPGAEATASIYLSNFTQESISLDLTGALLHRGAILDEYLESITLDPLTVGTVEFKIAIDESANLGRYRLRFVATAAEGNPLAADRVIFIVKNAAPVDVGLTLAASEVAKGDVLDATLTITNTSDDEVSLQVRGGASRRGPSRLRFGFDAIDVTVGAGETVEVDIALGVPSLAPAGRYVLRVLAGAAGSIPWDGARASFLVVDPE